MTSPITKPRCVNFKGITEILFKNQLDDNQFCFPCCVLYMEILLKYLQPSTVNLRTADMVQAFEFFAKNSVLDL